MIRELKRGKAVFCDMLSNTCSKSLSSWTDVLNFFEPPVCNSLDFIILCHNVGRPRVKSNEIRRYAAE